MKKLYLILFLLFHNFTHAQVQWASDYTSYSSQYQAVSWSIMQATGAPNTYPSYGDISTAWASLTADSQREFISMFYATPQPINTILIYETYNPGAIDTVYVKNPITNSWEIVFSDTAEFAPLVATVKVISFPLTSFAVNEVRIAINSPAIFSWNEIDAVGIGVDLNITTSVADTSPKDLQKIVYNTVTQSIQIISDENALFEVFDISGKKQIEIMHNAAITNHSINLPSGIYIAKNTKSNKSSKLYITK